MFILCLILILLIVTAFFSASETAITFASKAKIHQLAKSGNARAKLVKSLQQNLGLVISAILAFNTIINAGIVSLGAGLLFEFLGEYAAVFAPVIMGVIVLLYAEIIPKMLAIQNPTALLIFGIPFLNFIYNLFRPFNTLLNQLARLTLRIFGVKILGQDGGHGTLDELRGAIDMHKGAGDAAHERVMLKSILDLGSVQVGEIMVHRQNVTMINAKDNTDKIVDQVLACPYTRIPLWNDDQDNIVGIINTKALLRKVRSHVGNINDLNILDIANTPWFVPESTDLLDQLHAFRQRREHFALVVDEYGTLMGIVTLEDILEEIVGDITDEHDVMVKGIMPQSDGSYMVYGNVTIRDLNRQFDWNLPDEPAATVAGLLIHELRIIPQVGQIFNLFGFRFEVLSRQDNHLTMVKIIKVD